MKPAITETYLSGYILGSSQDLLTLIPLQYEVSVILKDRPVISLNSPDKP
jgi:hypothetical protein